MAKVDRITVAPTVGNEPYEGLNNSQICKVFISLAIKPTSVYVPGHY